MARIPFDPRKSAAMRSAAARPPAEAPLSPEDERALIEAAAAGTVPGVPAVAAPAAAAPVAAPLAAPLGPAATTPRPMTVKQVNALVNQALVSHLPAVFLVQGEVSNYRTYDRGHAFFTLKEPGAELPCVCWKTCLERLKFRPKDGMEVVARGSIKMYEPQGKVQLYVESIAPVGTGSLELAFRQLCEKLKAEGLFDPARKRKIPLLPQKIVVITSRTGDVLHDVVTTAYRRYPGLHTMLYPVRVQGDGAAQDIAKAIQAVNAHAEALGVELILLVRGGGSLEDLWAFNEEIVARAIVASRVPVATGIGHEPDTTIADLVGDLRGPTPTGVTELTIPDARGLRREIDGHESVLSRDLRRFVDGAAADVLLLEGQLTAYLRRRIYARRQYLETQADLVKRIEPRHAIAQGWRRVEEAQHKLEAAQQARLRAAVDRTRRLGWRLEKLSPQSRITRERDRLGALAGKLERAMRQRFAAERQGLEALARQLQSVGPQAVLDRGYSITLDASGNVIRSAEQVTRGDVITTRVADGQIKSTVGEPRQGKLF